LRGSRCGSDQTREKEIFQRGNTDRDHAHGSGSEGSGIRAQF